MFMVKQPYRGAEPANKKVHYLKSCLKILKEFPDDVKTIAAHALTMAAQGKKHVDAKPLKGFKGVTVQEVMISDDGNAYRVIFTVEYPEAVYVLHAFKKKSHRDVRTPRHEIDLVRKRLIGLTDLR